MSSLRRRSVSVCCFSRFRLGLGFLAWRMAFVIVVLVFLAVFSFSGFVRRRVVFTFVMRSVLGIRCGGIAKFNFFCRMFCSLSVNLCRDRLII